MFHPLFAAVLTVALTGLPAAAQPPVVSSCDAPEIAAGTYIDLDLIPIITGAERVTLVGINDRGDIVGTFTEVGLATKSFLLRQGEITILEVPGASATRVTGINASGTIVGVYTADSKQHGFVWTRGRFALYPASPWMRSLTFAAVSASGAIAGNYGDDDGEKAFVLRGSRLDLIDIARRWTFVVDINARGDVVVTGQNQPGPGRAHHFLVTRRRVEHLVGCDGLGGFMGGTLHTITNQGHLVGRLGIPTLPEYGGYSGVLYSERGVRVYNYPDAISTELLGMNTAGYAIGRAWGLTWHRDFLFIPHGQ
jgi:probable HAF family extracellular repeat protein